MCVIDSCEDLLHPEDKCRLLSMMELKEMKKMRLIQDKENVWTGRSIRASSVLKEDGGEKKSISLEEEEAESLDTQDVWRKSFSIRGRRHNLLLLTGNMKL